MSPADIAIVVICLLSGVFGFWRGLVKEALSLLTWVVAIVLALRFDAVLSPALAGWIEAPGLRDWVARAIIFIVVIFAGGFIAWAARNLIQRTGLGGTDRLLGGAFGLLRGVLIVGLCAIVIQIAGLDRDPWWQNSRLRPYGEEVADGIRQYGSLGRDYIENQTGENQTGENQTGENQTGENQAGDNQASEDQTGAEPVQTAGKA